MKIWITGIAGFIGSHLAEALVVKGYDVEGNDNQICNSWNIYEIIEKSFYSKIHSIDCRYRDDLFDKFKKFEPDVLVHCAATPAEGYSVFSPYFITRNIAEASVSTFSAAIASGVKRIVNMSSMARYGNGRMEWTTRIGPPFREEYENTEGMQMGTPVQPIDPYGHAKVYAENVLKTLCETHGVQWCNLVPHNVIGPRQQITPYRNVATIFLNRLRLGLPVYIYGDGEQKRCFSPIKDCLPSLIKAVEGSADGETVNIGPDKGEITVNQLLELCEDVTGKSAERVYLPPRPVTDSVKEAYCSSDKARKLLGYTEQQSLFDCLKEMNDALVPKPFEYNFPQEIVTDKMPRTWKEKLI